MLVWCESRLFDENLEIHVILSWNNTKLYFKITWRKMSSHYYVNQSLKLEPRLEDTGLVAHRHANEQVGQLRVASRSHFLCLREPYAFPLKCMNFCVCLLNHVGPWTVTCGHKTGLLDISKLRQCKSNPENCTFILQWLRNYKDLLCICSHRVHQVRRPVVRSFCLRGLWRKEVFQEVEIDHFL